MDRGNKIVGVTRMYLKEIGHNMDSIQELELRAKKEGLNIFDYLFDKKIVDDVKFAEFLSSKLSLEFIDLSSVQISNLPTLSILDEQTLINNHFIPYYANDKRLSIVTSNPLNEDFFKELKTLTGVRDVEILVGAYSDVKSTIISYSDTSYGISDFDDDELDNIDVVESSQEEERDENVEQAPIVKFVNKMLHDAIKLGASDLHFEPFETEYRIRFRIDGVLSEIAKPNIALKNHIAARLKVLSGMDIAEKRKPQDGRIKLKYKKENIDFRVSSLPTLFGEKLVLRILDSKSAQMGIEVLGYEKEQEAMYLEALDKPQGMILVTGPTGSGKTVSLYTGLNILNQPEINISTAEDPVEINLVGINQVNINNKAGMTFATALRAFLRQDPDIIMVGEIRDLETAEISIKASQTGHMVMSTLHTNSAAETITRLRNMGVPSYNVANSLNLIIAQRLVRRLCSHCKVPLEINETALRELGFEDEDFKENFTIYEPNLDGCPNCSSGYKGRAGVYEVVKVTKEVSKLILDQADSLTMNQKFKDLGFINLRRAALLKVKAGLTSLAEVSRVTIE